VNIFQIIKQSFQILIQAALIIFSVTACIPESSTNINTGEPIETFQWNVPARLPLPIDNKNNPATEEKFQLGRHLFYDKRISGNGTQSCSDCHQQTLAFTDGKILPQGSTGQTLSRNSQGLVNNSYNASYTWANTSLVRIEQQLLVPLFGNDPIEHGINDSNREAILETIKLEEKYQTLFPEAFDITYEQISFDEIVNAIAIFVRGINSFNSPYDKYLEGDTTAISDSAKRGEALFFGERFECFHCHGGYNFSDSTIDRTVKSFEKPFHNTGLYNIDGNGAYPSNNIGLMDSTTLAKDMGKFKAPSLRNVALTAPYTHDGTVATLREMLEIYAAGGRVIESGEFAGDGRANPFKDILVPGFSATEQELDDVVNFLNTLTDESLITNERFSNPWE